jgi:hypothetical protein
VLRSSGEYTQEPGSNPLAARWCDLPGTTTADDTDPPAGSVALYLVSGRIDGNEDGLGADGAGVPRPNDHPCP